MGEIEYIKRGSAGQGTGVNYDEVISDLQPLLIKHGVVVKVDFLADTSRKNPKGSYIYEGYFDVNYINIDNPSDNFTSKIVAHAMDAGDKAPGKAITYATKIAHLKTFGYETGEMDEKRTTESSTETLSEDQKQELFKYILTEDNMLNAKGEQIAKAYNVAQIGDIKAANFEKVLKQCKS